MMPRLEQQQSPYVSEINDMVKQGYHPLDIKGVPYCNILYNSTRKSIAWQGIVGAMVRQGISLHSGRAGLGDCILLDFSNKLFAVSDSSERDAGASRRFLQKLCCRFSEAALFDPTGEYCLRDVKVIENRLKEIMEGLLHDVFGVGSCTLTGVLVLNTKQGKRALAIHTGDSVLFEWRDGFSRVRPVTEKNFLMAGRSLSGVSVEEVQVHPDTKLTLVTDGYCDLNFPENESMETYLAELMKTYPVEEIHDVLFEDNSRRDVVADDLCLINLCPWRVEPANMSIILGGTPAKDEAPFRGKIENDVLRVC